MYAMSQSGGMYFSQSSSACSSSGSRLEYIASSATVCQQYSISDLSVEYSFQPKAISQPSYNTSHGTLSPTAYGGFFTHSAISASASRGYDTLKEYACFQAIIMPEYHFIPDQFICPGREGAFIGNAEEIRPFIEEAFQHIFGCSFPNHINISILSEAEFRKIAPYPGTIGLSINRTKYGGISEIFVLHDSLARVMLTLGHELGHVLTETLPDRHDEEAKAYAFSLAWMKIIKENNIADLGGAIVLENPARNGLHDISFTFVQKMLDLGKEAWKLYLGLINREIFINTSSKPSCYG